MTSNALSGRPFFPRPPVVCVSSPFDPGFSLTCLIWLATLNVEIYGAVTVTWFGSNTLRVKGEPVSSVWGITCGSWGIEPKTENRVEASGVWLAPGSECECTITVTSTWQDGTKMFASVSFLVLDPHF